jgi:hypothetical protein
MTEFSEYAYSADDLDGAKSCSCSHCRSEGRYDQDATCMWYRRPAQAPAPTLNRAVKVVA